MCYDQLRPLYQERGFHPLPLAPGEKFPASLQGDEYVKLTGWTTRDVITSPQPGAGIGLLMGRGVVGLDIDTDDPAMKAAIKSVVPESLVGKKGQARRDAVLL